MNFLDPLAQNMPPVIYRIYTNGHISTVVIWMTVKG